MRCRGDLWQGAADVIVIGSAWSSGKFLIGFGWPSLPVAFKRFEIERSFIQIADSNFERFRR